MSRHHRRPREKPQDVILPITPMLDMTFQLLSFFILTFRPTPMEGEMEFRLPPMKEAAAKPQPMDTPEIPEVPATNELIIRAEKGAPSYYLLKTDLDQTGKQFKELKEFLDHLRGPLKADKTPDKPGSDTIRVRPEKALKHAYLVDVMDAVRREEFKVGFGPPADASP